MGKIAFDLWGTLAYLKPGSDFGMAIAQALKITKKDYHELVKKFWFKRKLTAKEFAQVLLDETRSNEVSIDYLTDQILSPVGRHSLYPEVRRNLERLYKINKLVLISDTSSLGQQMFYDLQISKFFYGIYFSCEVGLTKEEGLYQVAFKDLRVKPQEVVVVGDSLEEDYYLPLRLKSQAILIDRNNKYPSQKSIKSLDELK